ncbi:hypothetical protein Ga0466249_000905 [Sporomusaceae bacterium BoRhaA]|jgi:hypothetical protein|uniref:hypothetical protein n=1 Tax=Pelorhabdus rhamnosifermentans TaxID=2772457 RepID=UPI001C0631C3|nr:hypothetical protein [Pelorhabdus rhamnosifermentans]MBU2699824.1 hypothetical protein [Pelorhabdus rhamnosifermentans]
MTNNLIDFSKAAANKKVAIDLEAAKKFFIGQVLPYVGEASLQRIIQANVSGDPHLIQLEMMRMFVESELMKPTDPDPNRLRIFFDDSATAKIKPEVSKK